MYKDHEYFNLSIALFDVCASHVPEIVADLEQRGRHGGAHARELDDRIMGGQSLELVGIGDERLLREASNLLRNLDVEAFKGVQTSAHSRTALMCGCVVSV